MSEELVYIPPDEKEVCGEWVKPTRYHFTHDKEPKMLSLLNNIVWYFQKLRMRYGLFDKSKDYKTVRGTFRYFDYD